MAKLYNHIWILGANDKLDGPLRGFKTHSGKTLIAHKPMFGDNCKHPKTQKTQKIAVLEATTYANFARMQEVYVKEARRTNTTAYYIAIADWFDAPRVREINVDDWTGEIGQRIHVKARDNVLVTRVSIVIRDVQENVLEMGEAVPSGSGGPWWTYTTKSLVRMTPFPSVEATVYDLPGNSDSFTIS